MDGIRKTTKIGKRRITSKKQIDCSDGDAVTLVGTYREKQLAWIKKHGVYNYPVKDEDELKPESCAKVKELWLYASAKAKRHCFAAEFVGIQGKDEFLAANPTYAKLGPSRHARYMVFKTKVLDYGPRLEGATVFARVSDFEKGRGRTKKVAAAIKQFHDGGDFGLLADYLPSDLAKLPHEQLRVCEAAVQLDFYCGFRYDRAVHSEVVKNPCQRKLTAMSLFSGAGGLDIGVLQAGFDVLSCVELDPNACETLRHAVAARHDATMVFEGDIKAFTPEQMLQATGKKPGEVDLLFGGPPCQAFSLIGKQRALDDERGMLLFQMIRYTKVIQPRVVMMEQVKGLLSARDADGLRGGVFQKLLKDFSDLGYVAKYKVCLAADYGAAQLRERVILVATKDRNGFEFPPPLYQDPLAANLFSNLPSWRTVGDVLGGLGQPVPKQMGVTFYPPECRNHVDVTPERDRTRIHYVPEGLYLASQTQLPKDILGNLQARDTTKYLRLSRGRPSNTLRCGEIFFHPTEDRYLTPREYMRIHGYPDDYLLMGPIRSRTGKVRNLDQHRQVANSVPPPLAKAIASQIRAYLEDGVKGGHQ